MAELEPAWHFKASRGFPVIRWLQPMVAGALTVVCFANDALSQRSTTEEITLPATAWTEICVAPCRVQVTGSDGALISIGSAAPASLNAPAMFIGAALLEGLPVRAAGKRVYARGWSRTTTLVAAPDDGAGPGGGDASAANQQSQLARQGAVSDSPYSGSGDGTQIALSKSQDAILRALLATNGALSDTAAITGNGTHTALLKALRDLLAAATPAGSNTIGAVLPPFVGADKRKITKCSVAANGATLLACTIDNGQAVASPAGVCPLTSLPMVTEIKTTVGGVGLGLNGQALTTGVEDTAAGTPDMPLPTANTLYTLPIGATNAITAYNPNGSPALVTCIQTLRP